MKPLVEQDYYETLDVARSAAFEDIERAYRLACDTYCEDSLAGYPVFEVGDVELLRERIEVAYRILVDPETRRAYDLELSAQASEARVLARGALRGRGPRPKRCGPQRPCSLRSTRSTSSKRAKGEWTGARLRRARLRQGIELDEITKITKVNPTYLAFIEDERFDGLPAAVYVRGFVMGYAGCLGLDADAAKRVAASYLQRYEERKGAGEAPLVLPQVAGAVAPPRYLVGESEDGQRLDTALAGLVGQSRSQVRRWIDDDRVRWNGRAAAASQLVSEGDWIDAEPPEPIPRARACPRRSRCASSTRTRRSW